MSRTVYLVCWVDLTNRLDFEAIFEGETLLDAWPAGVESWHSGLHEDWLAKVGIKLAYREATDADIIAIKDHFDIP